MAKKEGMIFKFFEKWKQNRLNSFAKNMLKNNPQLEKDLKKIDNAMGNIAKKIKKGEAPY